MGQTLTKRKKAGYAFGIFTESLLYNMFYTYYLTFLNEIVGIQPKYSSMIIFISIAWDAVTDPMIGSYSDRPGVDKRKLMNKAIVPMAAFFILAWTLLRLDSDTFYINHVTAVMVDNLRRLLLGINLSDKAVMDFDFPGVGFPIQFVYQDTVDKLMDVFIGQFLYVAVFPDNLNKP